MPAINRQQPSSPMPIETPNPSAIQTAIASAFIPSPIPRQSTSKPLGERLLPGHRRMPPSRVAEVLVQVRRTLNLYEEVCKPSAASMRLLIRSLEAADRIVLEVPLVHDGGEFSMLATLQAQGLGLTRSLDKPLLVEYDHGGTYDAKAGLTQALSTRRMALVIPMETEFAVTTEGLAGVAIDPQDMGAILVWSINYFEEKTEWEIAPSAAILPMRQAIEHAHEAGGWFSRLAMGWSRGAPDLGDPIEVRYQDMLPELIRQLPAEEIQRIAREMSMDACWAALGVLTAMSCSNVRLAADRVAPKDVTDGLTPLSANVNGRWVALNPFQGRLGCNRIGQWVWVQSEVSTLGG